MLRSDDDNPLLADVRAEKAKLVELFDEGYITTNEYQERLEGIFQRERGIYNEIDRRIFARHQSTASSYAKVLLWIATGFAIGFLVSPHVYSKMFGYRNAEECALDKGTKIGATMCFRLYRRKNIDD